MPKLTADQRADQAKVRDAANANRDAIAAADKPVGGQIAEQRQADTAVETGTRAPTDADFTAQVEAAAARAEAEVGEQVKVEGTQADGFELVELTSQGDVTRQFLEDSLNQIRGTNPDALVQVQLRCAIRILDAEVVSVEEGGACFRSGANGQTYWVTYNSIDAIIQ